MKEDKTPHDISIIIIIIGRIFEGHARFSMFFKITPALKIYQNSHRKNFVFTHQKRKKKFFSELAFSSSEEDGTLEK